jgi:hypothetical protein
MGPGGGGGRPRLTTSLSGPAPGQLPIVPMHKTTLRYCITDNLHFDILQYVYLS